MINTVNEIRNKFLKFFYNKGHKIIKSSSLIPKNDKTLLFTNSGMNQFKNIFLNKKIHFYKRIVTSQNCVRVGGKHNDLKNIGFTENHHTFFEMLGNFSFSDYFKEEAIMFAWELLTSNKWFNLSKKNLIITVHILDNETYNIWKNKIGIPKINIIKIGKKKQNICLSNNFWQMNKTGPCGPCTEIYYNNSVSNKLINIKNINNNKYIEIWNLVFMQFNRQINGKLLPLINPSIDTGMGLERIAAILQNVNSIYDIDIFKKLIKIISNIIKIKNLKNKNLYIITDHIRTSIFLINDGIIPSNEGRGYILRKIIRRAIQYGKILGIKNFFLYKLILPLINIINININKIIKNTNLIKQIIYEEEKKFAYTLKKSILILNNKLKKNNKNTINKKTIFYFYDTHGIPLNVIKDICNKKNIYINKSSFKNILQKKNKNKFKYPNINYNKLLYLNKKTKFLGYNKLENKNYIIEILDLNGNKTKFIYKGNNYIIILNQTPFYAESKGRIGDTGEIKSQSTIFNVYNTKKYNKTIYHIGKLIYGNLTNNMKIIAIVNKKFRKKISINHSATHLLNATLNMIIKKNIKKKKSYITHNYLKFDFFYYKPLELNKIYLIEKIINYKIKLNLKLKIKIVKKINNIKYINFIRILNINNFLNEFCNGTHINNTGDIGIFCILSNKNIGSGINRIEAITGTKAINFIQKKNKLLNELNLLLESDNQNIINKIKYIKNKINILNKNINQIKHKYAIQKSIVLIKKKHIIKNINIIYNQEKNIENKILRIIIDEIKKNLKKVIIILIGKSEKKINIVVGVTNDLIKIFKATNIINFITENLNISKGGGRDDLSEAGAKNNEFLLKNLNNLNIKKIKNYIINNYFN